MGKVELKVSRATDEEIESFNDFLNELSSLEEYFSHKYPYEAIRENEEDFPILSKLIEDNDDFDDSSLLSNICKYLNNSRYRAIIFNLIVLMDNCADKNCDTLEFNETLTKALKSYEDLDT